MDIKTVGGVDDITADGDSAIELRIDGNDLTISASSALPVRLIGMNGILLRSASTGADGTCVISGIAHGAYIVTVGNSAYKLMVK